MFFTFVTETIKNISMKKKTSKMTIESVKCSNGWHELVHDLRWEKFKKENPNLDEDELSDKFYTEEVTKWFEYGEFGDFEIIVDEDFKIVGGEIFPHKQ